MNKKKYWILIGTLIIFAVSIHFFSSNSLIVEYKYSNGIYPVFSIFLRYLFGWLTFSFGDILYGLVTLWLLAIIVKSVKKILRRNFFSRGILSVVQPLIAVLLLIYIIFNAFWGINYNRKGIASQLGLSIKSYSVEDLKTLNSVLLKNVNASKILLLQKSMPEMTSKEIFHRSKNAYDEINKQYTFLNYHPVSIKTSLWGWLGNYLGFMGYYNPFTGEGQVNTTIPKFLQPYTTCHEMAHQLGYAKENEANFVGYLAAAASKDEFFHYSVYLELFLYANRNLYLVDSLDAKIFAKQLLLPVKNDLREWRRFNLSHQNPAEPVVRWIYGKYLEGNQQPSGVLSYDEVNGFLIAYYKQFGKL